MLLIILITGVYLTLFYQFGFDVSYQAVSKIEASLIGRIMRALHRYASGAAIIVALLHGWRTFFMDRFRGPRWLAWVSGVGMAALVWAVGVTGYWMIWDERATVLNQTLFRVLENFRTGVAFMLNLIVTDAAGVGWIFMVVLITFHLGLSGVIGVLLWYHLKRLSRPKWFPPRYWMWIIFGILVVPSVLIPVGMLAQADGTMLPGTVNVDSWFLFYLPGALNWPPMLFWGGVFIIIASIGAVPWLLLRKPLTPIAVDVDRCTGCTLCVSDCPYKAISMVERPEGSKHKYLAVIDPEMCVSCGVCVGSCPPLALSLHGRAPEALWQETVARASQKGDVKVVFTCERHAFQGAKNLLQGKETNPSVQVVPLTCIGMAHPDLASKALEAGAREVQFVGCPLEDCANREGNVWLEQRLQRERKPKLRLAYAEAPIVTSWVAPNEFKKALPDKITLPDTKSTAYGFNLTKANWRGLIPGLILLGLVLAGQVWLSNVPYQPFPADQGMIEIAMEHKSGYPIHGFPFDKDAEPPTPDLSADTHLTLTVDNEVVLKETYTPSGNAQNLVSLIFNQVHIPVGTHHVILTMVDQADQTTPFVLYDDTVSFTKGEELSLHFTDGSIGGDPVRGKQLYYEMALGENVSCRVCHSLDPGVVLVGPSFAGIGTRAATRIPGMSAKDYLRQSILHPNEYKVPGFENQMLQNFGATLTEEQVDDLIAFLLTLK
ncbi:MAG: hydrogenase iron-sulfur subunit [Anaerolineales bacterium]|nr:hydrogenase iron-sulfur subunit [Anaerolineales bacterium]